MRTVSLERVVLAWPQVDLREARDAERLGELARVVRIVRQEAQQDRLAGVEPHATRTSPLGGCCDRAASHSRVWAAQITGDHIAGAAIRIALRHRCGSAW